MKEEEWVQPNMHSLAPAHPTDRLMDGQPDCGTEGTKRTKKSGYNPACTHLYQQTPAPTMPTAAKTVQPATMAETHTMTDMSETLDCFVLLRPKRRAKQNSPQYKSKSHSLFLTLTLFEEDRT